MQGQSDLGEQTLFGRIGLWALGVLGIIIWRVWEFSRSEIADMKKLIDGRVATGANELQQKTVSDTLARIERRLEEQDRAIESRVSVVDHQLVRNDVAKLFEKVEDVRVEVAEQYGELLNSQALSRNEIRATLDEQTKQITKAIHAVADRRSKSRE